MLRGIHPAEKAPPAVREHGAPRADPLSAFPTEAQIAHAALRPRVRRQQLLRAGVLALAGLVLLAGAILVVPRATTFVRGFGRAWTSTNATLVIETTPAGWLVSEGGRDLGVTPLSLSLPPGRHALQLRRETATRALDVTLAAGTHVVHHVDFAVAPRAGRLHVQSAPPGATVAVDGISRGVTPLDLEDLAPGEHNVTLTSGNRVLNERVSVAEGRADSLVVPFAPGAEPAAGVGWATFASPLELQVYEGEALIGSSRNQRIMLMPGRHALRLANPSVGFETTAVVEVVAGAVARVPVRVPNGSLSVNAAPWAEVLLDGKVIGETPIANYDVTLGSHELVLRHPRYGEQRRTILVTRDAPVRVGVDLRQ